MSVDRKYFVDVFGSLMPYIRENYDTENQQEPYFLYGTLKNIIKVLMEKSKSSTYKYQKYPLIALIQPFDEPHSTNPTYEYVVSPRVLILTPTPPSINAEQRYEDNYTTILYPIYDLLLYSMDRSNAILTFGGVDQILHTKTDQLNYGDDERIANIFNEYLDCIEIEFDSIIVPINYYECSA